MNRIAVRMISLLAFGALLSIWTFGQTEKGTIRGVVFDQQGAAIVHARVTATSLGTGLQRVTASNESGVFTIPSLNPYTYRVVLESGGFKSSTLAVKVKAGAVSKIFVQLQVGSGSETLDLGGDAVSSIISTASLFLSSKQ